eukprot:8084102-Alexandrium_andersonii.AAC.1
MHRCSLAAFLMSCEATQGTHKRRLPADVIRWLLADNAWRNFQHCRRCHCDGPHAPEPQDCLRKRRSPTTLPHL